MSMTARVFNTFILTILVFCSLLAFTACETLGEIGTLGAQIAAGTGAISQEQADAIGAAAESAEKAFESLTPEQEYYIGRSVAATILSLYPPLDAPEANDYLNTLGQTLAMASDKPFTFNGYRFLLLDSDEINAFATPGGFIFITKGLLDCAGNEAELAAVLAHEIGHVQWGHGVKAIKASRWTDTITKTAIAGVAMTSEETAEVTAVFDDSIGDITQTLVVNGYSRKQEKQADESAAIILSRVGYDPNALIAMLEEMDRRWDEDGHGFADTHPAPQERIEKVRQTIEDLPVPDRATTAVRETRYVEAFAGI